MEAPRLLEHCADFFARHAVVHDEVEADLGEGEVQLARRPLERPGLAGEVGSEIDDGNGFGGGHNAYSRCADESDDRTQRVDGLALGDGASAANGRRPPLARARILAYRRRRAEAVEIMRRKSAVAAAAVVILASSNAWAQAKAAPATEGLAAFLRLLTERIDITFSQLPDVVALLCGPGAPLRSARTRAAGRHLRGGPGRRMGGAAASGPGAAPHPWPRHQVAAAFALAGHAARRPGAASPCGSRRVPWSASSASRNRISPGSAISCCWRWSTGAASTSCSAPGCGPIHRAGGWRRSTTPPPIVSWPRSTSSSCCPCVARMMVQIMLILDASPAVVAATAVLFVPIVSAGLV